MTTTSQLMTADELLRIPGDGFRYELLKGELKKKTPAGHQHGRIAMNLSTPLAVYVSEKELGAVYAAETGFLILTNPDTVRAPDVAFVTKEIVDQVGDAPGYFPQAPDFVVEVVSPNDVYAEVEDKVLDWMEAGTKMLAVVNPTEKTVTVYRSLTNVVVLTENDTLDGGDVVPGWSIPIKDIFV